MINTSMMFTLKKKRHYTRAKRATKSKLILKGGAIIVKGISTGRCI